jgi:rhodanese-related sulfurtransferase
MSAARASHFFRDASAIFIAAACLGFAYNVVSPLGVRISGNASQPGGDAPAVLPAIPASAPDPAVQNETLAAYIFQDDAAQAGAETKLPVAMSWAEVKPLLAKGEIVLVDARDMVAYEAGHIPGAVSLPMATFNERIGEFTAKVPKNKPLVIYCASIRCRLAHEQAALLSAKFGYTDVREMPNGYVEWMVVESNPPAAPGGAR